MNTGDLLVVDYGCPFWLARDHCEFLKKGDIVMITDADNEHKYYTGVSRFGLGTLYHVYVRKMSAL